MDNLYLTLKKSLIPTSSHAWEVANVPCLALSNNILYWLSVSAACLTSSADTVRFVATRQLIEDVCISISSVSRMSSASGASEGLWDSALAAVL